MKIKLIVIIFISLAASCTSPERLDTSALKSTMEGYKIKRISAAQILAQANYLGDTLSKSLTKMYLLDKNIQLSGNKLIDSLNNQYKFDIRLLTEKDVLGNNVLYQKEKEVLEAYMEAHKQGIPLETNIQKIGDSLFIYSAPILDSDSKKNNDLKIWSIIMRKNEVIKNSNFQK